MTLSYLQASLDKLRDAARADGKRIITTTITSFLPNNATTNWSSAITSGNLPAPAQIQK